jgi:hypothetical protein
MFKIFVFPRSISSPAVSKTVVLRCKQVHVFVRSVIKWVEQLYTMQIFCYCPATHSKLQLYLRQVCSSRLSCGDLHTLRLHEDLLHYFVLLCALGITFNNLFFFLYDTSFRGNVDECDRNIPEYLLVIT